MKDDLDDFKKSLDEEKAFPTETNCSIDADWIVHQMMRTDQMLAILDTINILIEDIQSPSLQVKARAKVKELTKERIDQLLAEASAEANEKTFCDEGTATTETNKGELLQDDIAKLTAKTDHAAVRTTRLEDEVKELQAELAASAKL